MAVAPHFKRTLEAALEKVGLGTKRICPSCGARFYDLSRHPIECPKCRFVFEPEVYLRPRRPRPELREIAVPLREPPPEAVEEEAAEEEVLGEPLEEEVLEEAAAEEALPEELPETEEEGVATPLEARRRKRKPPIRDVDEAAPGVEGETLEGEGEEAVVEPALDEDETVGEILEEGLEEDDTR